MDRIISFRFALFGIACKTGVIVLRFAGEREGEREARGERAARVTRDGIRAGLVFRRLFFGILFSVSGFYSVA